MAETLIERLRDEVDNTSMRNWPGLMREAADVLEQHEAAMRTALALLDEALGDTDPPNEPDEWEDPVFHAHKRLAAAISRIKGTQEDGCAYPDCGCDEARVCFEGNPNHAAMHVNLPKRRR